MNSLPLQTNRRPVLLAERLHIEPRRFRSQVKGHPVKKILLVDDSRTTLLMERMMLEKRTSYQCITATNGLEAVEKAQAEHPDLVLMDVVMPQMNGFEACKRLRENEKTREIPVILVTTRGEESYMEAGFQSGCNDYVTKPINGPDLLKLLQSYLSD
jgi:CheY-like chemotaxis protein